ncbi:hypothetical protein Btru_076020 [Bulinus truncatus]|nr:hypothetical protein Btru_076020 [Bulinus truncatus]
MHLLLVEDFTKIKLTLDDPLSNMYKVFIFVAVALLYCVEYSASQDAVCSGRPDNWTIEIGCWGYKFCNLSKMVEVVNCSTNGTVLDRDTFKCLLPGIGHSECGHVEPCQGKNDGYYADLADKCISFYLCAGEASLGRQYCAAHLVFNEKSVACDWTSNVAPPCGTFQPT